jgi:hypothetical protein
MKKQNKIVLAVSIILIISAWYFFSTANIIGQVNEKNTDEEAIKQVVTSYFKMIKNYEWNNYKKEKGLELWVKENQEEQLNNPEKLPALEKSIKDNKISRKLIEYSITSVKINDNTAVVNATTIEESNSESETFKGTIKTYETLTLAKANNLWRIQNRDAVSMMIKTKQMK